MSTGILNLTKDLRDYLWEKGMQEHPVLAELRQETAQIPESVMQICPEQGALMANLIRLMSAKKTIEIGTFTGYSALAVALALPNDGKIVACDISEEWTSIGQKKWEKAGVGDKIDLRIAPALETTTSAITIAGAISEIKDSIFPDSPKSDFATLHLS